jgi:hypothetical protein
MEAVRRVSPCKTPAGQAGSGRPLRIDLISAHDELSVYAPYFCLEAPCKGDCINRLGLSHLSGNNNLDVSGCASHQDFYPDTSVPDIALKRRLKFGTVTCLACTLALNP